MRRRVGIRTYIAVISLASVGVTLGVQAVSPALPEIKRVFELSDSQIGWFVTTYVLPGVVLTVPMGVLGDAIGRRLLFVIALVVYGLAAIAQGLVVNFPFMLAMRAVQGTSFAAAMPLTITLLGDAFSGGQRIRALAGRNAVLTSSEVILPTGGALLGALSWRTPLFVQAVTIPLALYAFFILEEHQVPTRRKRTYARDLLGVLRGQQGMFAVMLTAFSRYFFKLVLLAFLPVMLVSETDATLAQVGIVISFASLIAVVTTASMPVLIRRIPPSLSAVSSMVFLALSTAGFALAPDWRWALVVAVAYGIGDGQIAVLQDTYAIHTARAHVRAGMVSISQTARNFGKFVGPLAMTAAVAVSSVRIGFLVIAALGLLMAPVMLQLRPMDRELQAGDGAETEPSRAMRESEDVPYE